MASWRKLLARMVADPKPLSYSYDEAATVLHNLKFEPPKSADGSHRVWRRALIDPRTGEKTTAVVELVKAGSGTLRAVYIKDMIRTLREFELLPEDSK